MEAYEALITRRSIRHFETTKKISDSLLYDLLKAAQMAPSAHNRQPWAFIVIDDSKLLHEIAKIHPHADPCREASLTILVLGDSTKEALEGFCVQGCAAATQNILLAAHSKNLGSVWMGIYPKKDLMQIFKQKFSIPDQYFAFSLIAIGYPKEKKECEERFDLERIHRNKF